MSGADILKFISPRSSAGRDVVESHIADLSARIASIARESGPTESDLLLAIEAIEDGFALWDADDRLVLCNGKYREIYAMGEDLFVRGAPFRDIVAECTRRGQFADAGLDLETWIEACVRRHHEASGRYEELLADGRRLLIHERRLANGGIVGVRVDITETKPR